MSEVTAGEAMAHAEAAHILVKGHEDLCAERYSHIQTSIVSVKEQVGSVMRILGWGGSILATVMIGLVAYFGALAMDKNDAELVQLRAEIAVMKAKQ